MGSAVDVVYLDMEFSETAQLPHVLTYERVFPQRVHHIFSKRDLHGTQEVYAEHAHYTLTVNGKKYMLKLQKNREFLGKEFSVTYYLEDGTELTQAQDEMDHCFYHGYIDGEKVSSASVNLCKGISGFFQMNGQMYLIEPLPEEEGQGAHAVYKFEHLKKKRGTCQDSYNSTVYDYGPKLASMLKPQPWRSTPLQTSTRYVELFLVVDHSEYLKYRDIPTVQHRMKEIVNHVDQLYRPLNFRIALIGMEIWTNKDKILLSSNAGETLDNFLSWRKSDLLRKKIHDNAQLITGMDFEGSTVGLATKLAMCTSDSGGVNQDHSANPIGAASTMAHEMGHNLGMAHDEDVEKCSCSVSREKGGCVMSKSVGIVFPKLFSSCSRKDLQTFLRVANPTCLLNAPDSNQLFGGPVCGNDFLESGEECDCGTPEECTNPCCNATACRLKEGAECAEGDCCYQCKIRSVGEMCRKKKGECDLPEYCTGNSAQCPDDAFQENGASCSSGTGYCYNGVCPSYSQHCHTLWGSEAQVAPDVCFRNNIQGNKHLHCKKTQNGYEGCRLKDVKCGRMHCIKGAEFPVTNNKYMIKLYGGQECKVAELPEEESEETGDPGMVPIGTKCGSGMVCFDGKCQDLSVYGEKNCSAKCNNKGICNHKRECHCDAGWAPPYCDQKFTDNNSGREKTVLIVGILVAILLFAVFFASGIFCKIFYKKKQQKKYSQKRMAHKLAKVRSCPFPLFQFLGFILDSLKMRISLPLNREEKICRAVQHLAVMRRVQQSGQSQDGQRDSGPVSEQTRGYEIPLLKLTDRIFAWAEENPSHLSTVHIKEHLNTLVDQLCRGLTVAGEWFLNQDIFRQLTRMWGLPDVDLIATQTITPGSGLFNPLFQENGRSRANIKRHLIGYPQLIASTANLQDSKSTFIIIAPSDGMEKTTEEVSLWRRIDSLPASSQDQPEIWGLNEVIQTVRPGDTLTSDHLHVVPYFKKNKKQKSLIYKGNYWLTKQKSRSGFLTLFVKKRTFYL
ncbi:disintegrin and metalloproteinase domain-containing protein 8 [Leptodactylus fuscus]